MNPELYKRLLEVDKRLDYDTYDYFDWTEERKQSLIGDIVDFFIPDIIGGRVSIGRLIYGFQSTLDQALEMEDYENAEIMRRCIEVLDNNFQSPKRK